MTTFEKIKEAIINKKQIVANYKWYNRKMCPHVIWTKNWRKQALFYQFWWESSKWKIIPWSKENWRCIQIDLLENVNISEWEWHTSNNHSKWQTCIEYIEYEI